MELDCYRLEATPEEKMAWFIFSSASSGMEVNQIRMGEMGVQYIMMKFIQILRQVTMTICKDVYLPPEIDHK